MKRSVCKVFKQKELDFGRHTQTAHVPSLSILIIDNLECK